MVTLVMPVNQSVLQDRVHHRFGFFCVENNQHIASSLKIVQILLKSFDMLLIDGAQLTYNFNYSYQNSAIQGVPEKSTYGTKIECCRAKFLHLRTSLFILVPERSSSLLYMWMDGSLTLVFGHRSSQSTFGAKKTLCTQYGESQITSTHRQCKE